MRPSVDQWAMRMAVVVASRSTCLRRSVGCVLLDKRNHVLATGYNGVAAGMSHCNHIESTPVGHKDHWTDAGKFIVEHPYACSGANSPSGTNLDGCEAIHAEQNALIQCRSPHDIFTVYTTSSPCVQCVKMLMNTSARRIVFLEEYPHSRAKDMWTDSGGLWLKISLTG